MEEPKSRVRIRDRGLFGTLALAIALTGVGCGYVRQARDDVQPKAVPAMRMAQTLNPDAGKNRKVVTGLDGVAGKKVATSYVESFDPDSGGASAVSAVKSGL